MTVPKGFGGGERAAWREHQLSDVCDDYTPLRARTVLRALGKEPRT